MTALVFPALGGALAATVIALLAYRRRWLSGSGAVAAVLVGTTIVAGGGLWWGLLLVVFFATSSALSRASSDAEMAARGSRRDAVQVLANGGIPAVLAALAPLDGGGVLFAAYAGAVAAAAADTWATELGRRSRTAPRLITSGVAVPAGTSGGVTPAGLVAALAGAATIAGLAALGGALGWATSAANPLVLVVGVALAGLGGSLADSLLGATLQARYRCPTCATPTERRRHRCGAVTVPAGGLAWMTNDVVNLAGAAVGAGCAVLAVGW